MVTPLVAHCRLLRKPPNQKLPTTFSMIKIFDRSLETGVPTGGKRSILLTGYRIFQQRHCYIVRP